MDHDPRCSGHHCLDCGTCMTGGSLAFLCLRCWIERDEAGRPLVLKLKTRKVRKEVRS